jgi:hypothetical protein
VKASGWNQVMIRKSSCNLSQKVRRSAFQPVSIASRGPCDRRIGRSSLVSPEPSLAGRVSSPNGPRLTVLGGPPAIYHCSRLFTENA